MARGILTGVKDMEDQLAKFADKAADRIARNVRGASLRVVQRSIKSIAPVSIKKSIGIVNEVRRGIYVGKVGVNVGKRSRITWKRWAAAIVIGVATRFRKTIGGTYGGRIANPTQQQLSTGRIPANGIVRRGYEAAKSRAGAAMEKAFKKSCAREVSKLKK